MTKHKPNWEYKGSKRIKNCKSAIASGLLAGAGLTGTAIAQDLTVKGWNIFEDDGKLVCVMDRVGNKGYLVRMGEEKQGSDFGYIAVYTKDKPVNICGNVTREVVFDIDGQRFTGTSVGEHRGDWVGAELRSNNPNLGERLAKRYVMTLAPDSDNSIKISLDGTFNAMAATRECNKL